MTLSIKDPSLHPQKARAFSPRARIWGLMALGVAIALTGGVLFLHRAKNDESRSARATADETILPNVSVFTVISSPDNRSLKLPGETAAWNKTEIYAGANGYIAKWYADIGDNVIAGQVLAQIDAPDLDAELLAAKAKLDTSVADVAVRQARADFAASTYERWKSSPQGVVSDQDREAKKAESAEAAAELNSARAQVMVQQAEVDRLTALTSFKQVRAPFDGTIIQRQIDIGNLVMAGSSNAHPLYEISQNSPMRIYVHAPQSAAPQLLKTDVTGIITSNEQPSLRIAAKVTRTAKAINTESRTIRVEIDVPNKDISLVPGMYIQAEFELPGITEIKVPAAALLYRSRGPQIAVVDPAGAVTFRDVTIASDDGNVVSIGSGIAIGDKVALNLSSQIAAGQKVTTNPVAD
jgi:RND family efflux transporter MFP subunit